MKKYILVALIIGSGKTFAQLPDDALRYSWYSVNGTARNMAVGGVMGSLGGDITATYVNPAGLGFYKTGEFVFTPAFLLNNTKSDFREVSTKEKKNALSLGPMGWVLGFANKYKPKKSSAISIAFNQTTSFSGRIHYAGLNNYSSFSEQFAEEFAKSNYTIDEVLNTNSPLPYSAAIALFTYLIDTVSVGGVTQVKAAPEYILDAGQALQQDFFKTTKGGIYEFAVAYAQNRDDKWFWGATLGIPLINYSSNTSFTETDTSSNASNSFKSFTYNDEFKTLGTGFNGKLGIIYRPKDYIRLGFAVHTPSFLALTDTRTTTLSTTLENPVGSYSTSSTQFTNNQLGEAKYSQTAPWKAMVSASYVFREVENVKKQRGFISADVEYVNHKGSRFSSQNEVPTSSEINYYQALNNVVKDNYKGAFNFRVGGELKFNTIMGRLGFAYYGKPYTDPAFKASQMLLSGGLGYRNKGFFIDLTYAHKIIKDVNFPYRLQDRLNTYATINQQQGNIVASVGVKF